MQKGTDMNTTLVIIPTYNEYEALVPIVERVLYIGYPLDILIVDDDSPDGTGQLADYLSAAHEAVHVLHRHTKDGLGQAYLAGFAWGLELGYESLVEMDADGSHHPEYLPELLRLLETDDVVLGSRWVPGGRVEGWPLRRRILSRGGNAYARLALGIGVKDPTGGFRAFRAEALRRIDLESVASHGYCFQIDLVWRALQSGLRVVEAPITFTEREVGQSKMSGSIVAESLLRVTAWGVRRRMEMAGALVLHHHRLPSVRTASHTVLPQR